MADSNIYEELKDALEDFKTFLDENVATIRPAIQALASIIEGIVDVIDLLVDLMNDIKTEIQNLDVSSIPGLSEVSEFTTKIASFLDASADLLPDEAEGTVSDIRSALNVVGGLPSLDEVKQDILDLIDAIVGHLNSLKPA
jgi:ABC-type transporter Mla subunit MlaD